MPTTPRIKRMASRIGLRGTTRLRDRLSNVAATLKTAVQSGPVRTLKEMTPEERTELERLYQKPPKDR